MESIKKYIIAGIGVAVLIILSNMFIAYQNRKLEEQQRKIIEVQANHPKTITKTEYAKADTIYVTIKAKAEITGATSATLKPNGDVVLGGTNLSVKSESELGSKEERKESGKETETKIPVYTDITKEYTYILLGIAGLHITGENDLIGIKGSILTGSFLFQCSYYRDYDFGNPFDFGKVKEPWRQTLEVSVSYTLLKF